MKNSIPTEINNLKKRLLRFIEPPVDSNRRDVLRVMRSLEEIGDYAIFGGVIRELAFKKIDFFQSDVDIVVNASTSELETILKTFEYEKNRFDGFRIKNTKWAVDVWSLDNTWAFKKELVECKGLESLPYTTFFNWDSAAFINSSKKLVCSEGYLNSLQEKILDLNLKENPNPFGAAIRTLRFIIKNNARVTRELTECVYDTLKTHTANEICEFENRKFLSPVLREKDVSYVTHALREYLTNNNEELFSIPDAQLQLPFKHPEISPYRYGHA